MPIDRVLVDRVDRTELGAGLIRHLVSAFTVDYPSRSIQFATVNSWHASMCQLSKDRQAALDVTWRDLQRGEKRIVATEWAL